MLREEAEIVRNSVGAGLRKHLNPGCAKFRPLPDYYPPSIGRLRQGFSTCGAPAPVKGGASIN